MADQGAAEGKTETKKGGWGAEEKVSLPRSNIRHLRF